MNNSTIFVCGILRNAAQKLLYNYNILQPYIHKNFSYSRWFFYENDSEDNTVKILQEIQSSYKHFEFLSEKHNAPQLTGPTIERARYMGKCRNQYLKKLAEENYQYDYVLVVDLDMGEISVDGISEAIKYDADMVGCNGRYSKKNHAIYYDCWALKGLELRKAHKLCPKSKKTKVISCFGGMGLYKASSLKDCWYSENTRQRHGADHGTLHKAMSKLGRNQIYICPSWVTYWK